MADRWQHLRSERRGSFRIFSVGEDYYRHPELSGERSFFVIHSADWANVVAITPADEVLLIRQFRPGVRGVRLEIPGGVVDPGEEPAATAARELLEETGYAGDPPEHVCSIEPNPAIQDNECHTFVIRNARRVAEPTPDADEQIELELVPRGELDRLLEAGAVPHALIQLALLRFLRG